jgi:hypothetical protein
MNGSPAVPRKRIGCKLQKYSNSHKPSSKLNKYRTTQGSPLIKESGNKFGERTELSFEK